MLALCVMKPAELLENLGVVGVAVENPVVCNLCILKLG
jgi:hypothetical protein